MRELVYRDDEGLRNLLAQVQDLQSTMISVGHQGKRESTIGSKLQFGLGKILAGLGLPEAEMGGETALKQSKETSEKGDFIEVTEAVYRRVLRDLSSRKRLYTDAYDAWCAARISKNGIFCEFEKEFVPAGWMPCSDTWRNFANEQGVLVLHENDERSILLGMKLTKMFGTHEGKITPACHLAMRLRGGKVHFRVFGVIDSGKYIKPYLVTYS